MRQLKKRIRSLLCVMLAVMMLAGCANDTLTEREKRDPSKVTPTPTESPATPTPEVTPTSEVIPTQEVTPTQEITPTTEITPTQEITPTPSTEAPSPTPEQFASVEAERAAFDEYLDSIFVDMVGTNNLSLHFILEYPEKLGITVDHEFLEEDYDLKEMTETMKGYYDGLARFTYDNLTEPQKVNYDRLVYEYETTARFSNVRACDNYFMAVNNNAISSLSTLLSEYAVVEEKDIDLFLDDIRSLPAYFDSLFALMEDFCKKGACPTQEMYDTTIKNIKDLYKDDAEVFVAAFKGNMASGGFSQTEIDEAAAKLANVLKETFVPAAKKLEEQVETLEQYISDPVPLANREGGREYYKFLIQAETGSNLSPERMLEYMQEKLVAMVTEYLAIKQTDPDAYQRYKSLKYGTSDFNVIVERQKEFTEKEYPTAGDSKYVVSALPDELCVEGVMAYFLHPQADNDAVRVIRVNPHTGSDDVELFSTLAHEGYPGHLYQNLYFRRTEGYHKINAALGYTGYAEGWATMMGTNAYLWATNDKNAAFYLDFDYTYGMTVYSCVDIGVNYFGWSKTQIASFMETFGMDPDAADYYLESVVEDPGVALPYSYSHFQCLDIIDELMAKGMTQKEAYEAFLKVGPASIGVLRKHLGLGPEQ